jgi:hypothetical protein
MRTVHRCRSIIGILLASAVVGMAVAGPPMIGESVRPIIALRHHVLMLDREFDRISILRSGPSRRGFIVCAYRAPASQSKAPRQGDPA